MLMASGCFDHLSNLCVCNVVSEDPTHTDTVLVNMEHDSGRTFTRLVEETFKDIDYEFHRRVVIVQNQHAIEGRFLGLGLRLRDDGRARPDRLVSLLLLRHDGLQRGSHSPPFGLDMETVPHWKGRFQTCVLSTRVA